MDELEDNCEVICPYCSERITMKIDLTAGKYQKFVYDCEVCCQPIVIHARIHSDGGIDISTERES